jgi:hypothetical protein
MGFGHKFAYSFFNFEAYREFLIQGLRKSILYIFLVTLLFSTITNIKEINTIATEITGVQNALLHNAPNFEFKNGLLSVDSNEPIYYKTEGNFLFDLISTFIDNLNEINSVDADKANTQDKLAGDNSSFDFGNTAVQTDSERPNYYLFVIDTSGKTNKSVLDTYKDGVYIDSNELYLKEDYRTVGTIDFLDFSDINLTNLGMLNVLYMMKFIFPIIILVVNPLSSFVSNLLLGLLIFGPFTVSIGTFMGIKLKYSRACTLSFYAMSLPLLLEALLNVAGIVIPEFFVIFSAVTLIYCGLAIREIKNIDKSELNFMQ